MEIPQLPALHPGQRLELDITTVAFGGDGIGRVDNFVVFVPFVIEGERVEVEIVEVKRRYATADLVRVITPSPRRVEARCPYYMKCAGCQYQHVEYAHQRELKRSQIRDVFQRIGKIAEPPIEAVVGSPREYHYRNKIVVHGPGKPGFWTVRGRSIIGVEQCPIAREEVNAKLAEVAGQALEDVHLTIRTNSAGEVWLYTETRRARDPLDEPDPSLEQPPVTHTLITETILGRRLQVPLGSFFQVNREVIELALGHARKIFAASGCKILVDAYCGVGLFALMLSDLAGHVYGIEEDAKAIKAANENAERLGVKGYDFYPGRTERLLFYTLRQCNLDETCLILDPPRSGCAPVVLKALREQKPRKIIYVSCAPPMLARDIKELTKSGYKLERVTPFDMFPQTAHCEAVAEMVRR
ncbi:MAG TPA: class I SAM-dependent RNA methyltransferase [Verrucomicrobiae bacterium]|nr:class I SAM-dependent RNA methyltransferase [Verrucomicrobiae bacterium]